MIRFFNVAQLTVKSMKSLPGTGVWSWSTAPEKEIGDPAGPLRLLLNLKKWKFVCHSLQQINDLVIILNYRNPEDPSS
jgi:hypothetical protein